MVICKKIKTVCFCSKWCEFLCLYGSTLDVQHVVLSVLTMRLITSDDARKAKNFHTYLLTHLNLPTHA